jgi:hypothetical protein
MRKLAIFFFLLAPGLFAQPACPNYPGCLYTPARSYGFERMTMRTTYTDLMGLPRTVEFTARIPIGRSGAMPVILWAHGGGEGLNAPNASRGALSVWSEITAESGYLTISPAFHAREDEERRALCGYLGYPEGEVCDRLSTPLWDRSLDIKAILDELERQNLEGPLQGRIDMGRIAVGGHSAGSTGVLTVGGAGRQFRERRYDASLLADPRPRAIVALSPTGPGLHATYDRSFNDDTTSWDTITRPTLAVTGLGDAHEGAPHLRRVPFAYMPPGDKYQLWIKDVTFGHGAYGDDLETCGENVTRRKCEAFKAVLTSAVLSFLDAYIEQRQEARTYLESGFITRTSTELVEWSTK